MQGTANLAGSQQPLVGFCVMTKSVKPLFSVTYDLNSCSVYKHNDCSIRNTHIL